ncbi:MAG: hypothetical protein AMS27_10225 [Bacteroides sp. SM23_62_1]|nr:MAG: hypothetical protein AMS27_10225 [Bacteroides sp. SM23_62_1]
MAILKAFKGFRPKKEFVKQIASPPYDVLSSDEAREMVRGNPLSFLHVIKPEVDLPGDIDLYAPEVYQKGKENLYRMIDQGIFFQDQEEHLYIYAQTMWGKTQYGLVGCAGVLDYMNNLIRRHELTRPDKEEDRKKHIRITNFNAEPVFFAYPPHREIDDMVKNVVSGKPENDFVADDEIRHQFWVIRGKNVIDKLIELFETDIPFTYVADGHHRSAAAALVGHERRHSNHNHSGKEEYNYFLAVHFPSNQLRILDYNRVVKDLNGLQPLEFIDKLKESFEISERKESLYKPARLHNISMYLDGKWYSLTARPGTYNNRDPIGILDVNILSKQILEPILNITDLRKSKRIDFIGGKRGLEELKKRVDSGEMKAAFALHPVTMEQLMDIADTDNIMPPKTTWFEPKLRSGLILHHLE